MAQLGKWGHRKEVEKNIKRMNAPLVRIVDGFADLNRASAAFKAVSGN